MKMRPFSVRWQLAAGLAGVLLSASSVAVPPTTPIVAEWRVTYEQQSRSKDRSSNLRATASFSIHAGGAIYGNPISGSGTISHTIHEAALRYRTSGFNRIEDHDCPASTMTVSSGLEASGFLQDGRLNLNLTIPGGRIRKRENYPCKVTVIEPGIPITVDIVTTAMQDRFHSVEIGNLSVHEQLEAKTYTYAPDSSAPIRITLERLRGCDNAAPTAEVSVPPQAHINARNEIALGRTQLSFGLTNKTDQDCRDEMPVADYIDSGKTNWRIVGVDAKSVTGEGTVEWSARQLGTAEFHTQVDDRGRPQDDAPAPGKTLTVSVVKPTGERNVSAGWFPDTIHHWDTQLEPLDVDFNGIQVVERDLGNGDDSCWFEGSAYPRLDRLNGDTFAVGLDNRYIDKNGVTAEVIEYYRNVGRAPCTIRIHQAMDVVVPGGNNVNYSTTWISYTIEDTTIRARRYGEEESRAWP